MTTDRLLSEERIAFLVAGAVERQSQSAIEWAIRTAVKETGEAAAKLCADLHHRTLYEDSDGLLRNSYADAFDCDAEIRRRL